METIQISSLITDEFQVSEAIKTLRTNILFSGADVRCVGLTSSQTGDGKSTIAIQLAASLAQSGRSVVLLDTDMRKSQFSKRLKRSREAISGLSHYLTGMVNASELLCQTDIPGFYIIFAGVRVPNPTELLGSAAFTRLVKALREQFDYVIVDAPPLGQVIDCAIEAPSLDGILIVVDVQHNSYKLVRRIKNQLEKANGKILGVVLNRVNFKDTNGYYGKVYGKYGGYY